MILVDTSIWVDHLKKDGHPLAKLLEEGHVLMHDMVAGELACGNLRDRQGLMKQLSGLPQLKVISHQSVMAFIEDHGVMGKGIGFVDVHLLAATKNAGGEIWTRDKNLLSVASGLSLSFDATTLGEG